MARTEWSPNKGGELANQPPELSLCMVTHYSNHAYHKNRMPIVRLCLDTMLAGVPKGVPFELVIWDNGSTSEFVQMLESYRPTVLVKSGNVGVGNAQAALCHIARGRLICLTDDDVLFHPRWFHMQHAILKTYPNVGEVSGSPQRTAFRWGVKSGLDFGERNSCLEVGRLIPEQYERDFAISVGRDPVKHYLNTVNEVDSLLHYKKVKAWAHGHHMQMLAHRKTILPFIEIRRSSLLYDDARKFNVALDEAGLLNLTTYERSAIHIGNVVDESIRQVMHEWGIV